MSEPVAFPWDVCIHRESSLVDWLGTYLGALHAEQLVNLGSVYVNRQRRDENMGLQRGDALRVHRNPRRFFPEDSHWKQRIIANHTDYLIINKPAGIPVHPTCDNNKENLLALLQTFLGIKLWVVHRLDIATSGLMVMGKNLSFCQEFQKKLESQEITKEYHCIIEQPIATGIHTHFMGNRTRAPFPALTKQELGTKPCSLEVISCNPISDLPPHYWKARVLLHTGKQHQIRAQFATLGRPIIGDFLYGSTQLMAHTDPGCEKISLYSTGLQLGPLEPFWELTS
ncbi:MAG: RNA pseudouridine synthase [Proteobacteria bacterium]|nr:RNA pseudouridine synthase [Pseudomonadota bacterium]